MMTNPVCLQFIYFLELRCFLMIDLTFLIQTVGAHFIPPTVALRVTKAKQSCESHFLLQQGQWICRPRFDR
jgi:hypothetical protein